MLQLRPANERGHFQNHWLDSKHSFSFGEYYDPKQMALASRCIPIIIWRLSVMCWKVN